MQNVHLDILSADFLIVTLLGSVTITTAVGDILWPIHVCRSVVSLKSMTTFTAEDQTAEKIDLFNLKARFLHSTLMT